jgi:anti-sigma B factor antagonist
MNVQYKLNQKNSVPLIELNGRFDAEGGAFLKGQLPSLVSEQQPNLIIDMNGVTFVDSLGLTALVSGLKLCRKNRGILRLVGLQPSVRLLFEITRLDHAFELYDSVEAAMADFNRG